MFREWHRDCKLSARQHSDVAQEAILLSLHCSEVELRDGWGFTVP